MFSIKCDESKNKFGVRVVISVRVNHINVLYIIGL